MTDETFAENFVRFLAQLEPKDEHSAALLEGFRDLGGKLSNADVAALNTPRFSFEQGEQAAARPPDVQWLARVRTLAQNLKVSAEPTYRVARRDVPIAQPMLADSQPAWAAGTTPEHTIGPVTSQDGRRFWLDFFPVARLVPLYLPGESDPALLFYVPNLRRTRGAVPINTVMARFKQARYTLDKGSLWVRADLLAPGSPMQGYVGFSVQSGEIVLSKAPQNVQGKLTIPAGASCALTLQLQPVKTARAGGAKAGNDVSAAQLRLPDRIAFHFSQTDRAIETVGRAGWTLYGQKLSFTWDSQQPPAYDATLKGISIPLNAGQPTLTVSDSHAPFAQASGSAVIKQATWVLPVAAIDISQPTAVTGNGGIAVLGNSTLTLTWRGLRDGPVQLPQPWIVHFPGLVVIVDLQASNLYANQHFYLWQDADSPRRSSVDVHYTDAFPLYYAATAQGAELVLAQVDAEARLDRPVDVSGSALAIRSKQSLLVLSYTDTQQMVYLYDDNILVDNLDPNQPAAGQLPEPIALALHNALFTTTPVNGFLLFAELLDEEVVDTGNVFLVFGLYGLLPALPDPYAANVGIFRRVAYRERTSLVMLLIGQISWTKAADDGPDAVDTRFRLLPLGNAGTALMASSIAPTEVTTQPEVSSARLFATHQPSLEADWDRRFRRFYQEQFALLDVSTNADWMGVSLGWFSPETVSDNDYIFYKVYGAKQTGDQSQSLFPLHVDGLDLTAEGRFVRAFTVPQNSWEPLFNLTPPSVPGDPPALLNFYPNDGGPTRLFNDDPAQVPIAPLPKVDELLSYFNDAATGFTGALFTLPFGLKAFAEINKNHAYLPDAGLSKNQQTFRDGELTGALQLRVDAPARTTESPMFIGSTLQLNNIVLLNGTPTAAGTLGNSVAEIFNNEFYVLTSGYGDRGVPLERIDFSGYGTSTFSHWENREAAFAETSQARFDVFIGRTAHEVIQVKSVVYPWGIRVVRTIVIFRAGSSYVYRFDTGWQAETPGLYDFSYRVKENPVSQPVARPNPFEFHPGLVKGVYNVHNITETPDIPMFERVWNKVNGDTYIDDAGVEQVVDNSTPSVFKNPEVKLQPVYFDADVAIEFVESGAVSGRVPSRGMLGYVQLGPKGQPIPDFLFRDVLREQFGSLGGPVDCVINIGETGQHMRVTRVDVSESIDAAATKPLFVSTARGSVILPKDGSWSVVQYAHGSGEVSPLPDAATVPLIRQGKLGTTPTTPLRLENPMELVRTPQTASIFFGLLQSTGTQKAMFRKPRFEEGLEELLSETPDFSDAYRMLNSAGIFPNLQDAIPLALGSFKTKIIAEGYKLLDEADPEKVFETALPDGPWYIINEDFLKIYVEYDKRDKNGTKQSDGFLDFGIDSAAEMSKRWLSKLNNIGMVVDLGPLTRLMIVKGKFDAEKGAAPSFQGPELEFSDALQPVIDILQILLMLQGGDYADALAKGLEIAMSNSADSWAYAFHARKEIPLLRFPPPALDSPTAPLKLEASLGVGVYFNEVFALTDNPGQLIPSAGAFLEFYGRLSVMCVSVAAATIYATGSVDLRLAADIKTGPSLHMKFGFGAEINAGLPVVGNVSLLYMVGVEIVLDNSKMITAAFLLFRGRAEILGGIVTVTIMIEAKGMIERLSGSSPTNMIAQVTFGLDISIFLVINISFSESWQESRQIA
jgi:hypothetical protein